MPIILRMTEVPPAFAAAGGLLSQRNTPVHGQPRDCRSGAPWRAVGGLATPP
ncbi:MAG TPA: hypothetical protein VN153_00310 [Tahibacter sp.]|nr:hypothetical protein [Tahibacter sp.]